MTLTQRVHEQLLNHLTNKGRNLIQYDELRYKLSERLNCLLLRRANKKDNQIFAKEDKRPRHKRIEGSLVFIKHCSKTIINKEGGMIDAECFKIVMDKYSAFIDDEETAVELFHKIKHKQQLINLSIIYS